MNATFVSYAQNFEDVMLWRALKHVEHGFYIDVGAGPPTEFSVTKAFYDRGWHGINIEPHPEYDRQLRIARPRDISLGVALGDHVGDVTMHFVNDTGLSTIDTGEAGKRATEGFDIVDGVVSMETLASVWTQHVAPDQPVHFLKVDVEGAEREVLLGGVWATCRPWIVVVEATRPGTRESSYQGWESILTGAGYGFAYADGLNRFYIAGEREHLRPAFAYPPNVFDGFVRASEVVEPTFRAALAEAKSAATRAARAEAELAAVRATRSWRITRPLRVAARRARGVRRSPRSYNALDDRANLTKTESLSMARNPSGGIAGTARRFFIATGIPVPRLLRRAHRAVGGAAGQDKPILRKEVKALRKEVKALREEVDVLGPRVDRVETTAYLESIGRRD